MRKTRLIALTLGVGGVLALGTSGVFAADHAEAPGTQADSAADISDFYAWHTADDKVVAVIDFAGLAAAGDPATYDADVLYGIHIDNDGDNEPDLDVWVRFGQNGAGEWGVQVVDLPGGALNHHWTKNVVASPDGRFLYVTVGSNSNVGENGTAAEEGRAAIWQVDPATGQHRIFASGLRNPNGMAWAPDGRLWTAVNERDEIGSDLVPDYMTSVQDGGFYGWPYSYYGQTVDERVKPPRPDLVAKAIKPDYALGAHTASLGLTFSAVNALTPAYRSGAFIGQHGSWNRNPKAGYQVIYVPFDGATPAGPPQTVLTGFLSADGKQAFGRPVGVAINPSGDLLVADDVGNTVWRVSGR